MSTATRVRFAVVAVVHLLLASLAYAQDQGGGIQGVVRDPSRAFVSDVVIEARSLSMPGVATAVSDSKGVYRFPRLQPGVYELSSSPAGFAPVQVQDISITLGAEFRIDINLVLANLSQDILVTAERTSLDTGRSATITTLNEPVIRLLPPGGRNFTDLLTTVAGVQSVRSGLSIDGSTGPENNYIVNGVKTNDVLTGASAQPVRLDFVEEIQLKSSGYNAEHSASMGGVVNVITKSGGDDFHGFVGTYFFDPNFRWNGSYRPTTRFSPVDNRTPQSYVSQTEANTKSPDYEVLGELGGPVVKKRLWFYVSDSSTYEPSERIVLFSTARQDGPGRFTAYEASTRFGYAATASLTPQLRTRVAGSVDRVIVRRSLPGQMEPDGYTTLANPATRFDLTGEDRPSRLMSAHVDYAVRQFYVDSRVGYTSNDRHDVPSAYLPELRHTFGRSNIGLTGVPLELQFPANYTSTPLTNVGNVKARLSRLAWDATGTYFAAWHGQHSIKAGLNSEWVGDDVLNGNTAPNITLQWNQSYATPDNRAVRGPFGYYSVIQRGTFGTVSGNMFGLFLQDSWQPNGQLTVNVGVRTEREVIPSYNPELQGLRFGFGDKLAPRIGAAWDLTGNGLWKAYGSYGTFFDTTKLRVARFHLGGEVLRTYYYSLDTPDWRSVTCRSVGPPSESGCPGEYYGFEDGRVSANASGQSRIEPNLEASRTHEFALGLDHELSSRTTVGVRYVRKSLGRLVEDVGISRITPTSRETIYKICNPGFGVCADPMAGSPLPDGRAYPALPRAQRNYDALEWRYLRRLRQNLYVNGSYTWSYLRGNISGLGNEDAGETGVPNITSNFDTIFMGYDAQGQEVVGRLPHDRPHAFKLQGAYTLPWGTSLAVNYLAQSGSLESTTITQRGRYTFINGRGDLGRVPTFTQTDVRLQHDFRVSRAHSVNLAMDVRNLFDQRTVVDIGNTPYRDSFTIPDEVYFSPRGFDIAAYVAAFRTAANDPQGLNNLRGDAFYGQPQGSTGSPYQIRRTIQFSAKYRF